MITCIYGAILTGHALVAILGLVALITQSRWQIQKSRAKVFCVCMLAAAVAGIVVWAWTNSPAAIKVNPEGVIPLVEFVCASCMSTLVSWYQATRP